MEVGSLLLRVAKVFAVKPYGGLLVSNMLPMVCIPAAINNSAFFLPTIGTFIIGSFWYRIPGDLWLANQGWQFLVSFFTLSIFSYTNFMNCA